VEVSVAPEKASGALLVYAHPYPERSLANRTLLRRARDVKGVTVRSLYEEYPDFDLDVSREQTALSQAELVIWQHPMYWYSVPGLLKHWFDKVLVRGWAYGDGGNALRGKRCLWVATTGGDESAYSAQGMHERPFAEFTPVIEQTARFCGMSWLEPFVVHGAPRRTKPELEALADAYQKRLEQLVVATPSPAEEPLT
jgi:glutathione-regulated potassium-efflux system ancillary protein KefF